MNTTNFWIVQKTANHRQSLLILNNGNNIRPEISVLLPTEYAQELAKAANAFRAPELFEDKIKELAKSLNKGEFNVIE